MESIFFCPKCFSTYGFSSEEEKICSECKCATIFSGFTDSDWYAMPYKEREEKKKYIVALGKVQPHNFTATDSVEKYISYDASTQIVYVNGFYVPKGNIFGYDLVEDGVQITRGGLGAAVAGGLIGSLAPNLIGRSTGAIVGASIGKRRTTNTCTSMDVIIILKDFLMDSITISLIDSEVNRSSAKYLESKITGQKIIDFLSKITSVENTVEPPAPANTQVVFSAADEIKKLKELLDMGVITQEEFNAKKKQLLGL